MAAHHPHIAVVGPGRATTEEEAAAEAVGRLLAEEGATIVCGGLGGVMAAVCRGAASAAGTSIGILPGADRADANDWVDVAIPTGLGEARNTLVVRSADALIAVGGAYGTLSEVAFALRLGIPVVGLGTWHLIRGDGEDDGGITRAADPDDAVGTALRLAGSSAHRRRA